MVKQQMVVEDLKPYLVGGWTNPSEKYAKVKLNWFPQF